MGAHTGQVMTLANSIIGVGILAMPFCFQKCGVLLSILLLLVNNLLTRVSCHYLIKSSQLTRRRNFEFLAFHAFGFSGKLMVELCVIGYLMGTCIAYYVVVGDLGPQIISKLFKLNNNDTLRTCIMVFVTLICVVPLGLLKNVDSLSAVCTASIGFYFCLVLKVVAESKTHLTSGDWYEKVDYWKPAGILQCLPIFSMALSCQMQLFEIYETMPNATLDKMNSTVKSATNICTVVYILVGLFGYIAFCNQEFSGNILLNFAPSFTSDAIKIGFVLSVAFSFPLVIFPCRASLYSLIYRRNHSDAANYIPEPKFKWMTFVIVLITLLVGLFIPSIELVIGLVGSTIGVVICIMFPSSCFYKVSKKESNEKTLAQLIFIFGFSIMILGTYANLEAIDVKKSGPVGNVDFQNVIQPTLVPSNNVDGKIIKEIDIDPNIGHGKLPVDDDVENVKDSVKIMKLIEKNVKHNIKPAVIEKPGEEVVVNNKIPRIVDILPDQKSDDSERKPPPPPPPTIITEILKKNEIDKNAIKKEDEVVREEKADEPGEEKKEKIEKEIKKLEETKKQLEQEVSVMQEIVQQSIDTHNLNVVEVENSGKLPKLSEQIETNEASNVEKVKLTISNPVVQLLTGEKYENIIKNKKIEEVKGIDDNNPPVIDLNAQPISYKVGELLNEDKNNETLEKKLIPLLPALAIQTKNIEKLPNVEKKIEDDLKPNEKQLNRENQAAKETLNEDNSDINPKSKPDDHELIDSIRRDLLELNVLKGRDAADATTEDPLNLLREKRDVDEENCDEKADKTNDVDNVKQNIDHQVNSKLNIGESILEDTKYLNDLLRTNIESEIISVGRDLKSYNDSLDVRER